MYIQFLLQRVNTGMDFHYKHQFRHTAERLTTPILWITVKNVNFNFLCIFFQHSTIIAHLQLENNWSWLKQKYFSHHGQCARNKKHWGHNMPEKEMLQKNLVNDFRQFFILFGQFCLFCPQKIIYAWFFGDRWKILLTCYYLLND